MRLAFVEALETAFFAAKIKMDLIFMNAIRIKGNFYGCEALSGFEMDDFYDLMIHS